MQRNLRMKFFLALFVVSVSAAAIVGSAAGGYHLLQKVSIPGDGGWDYCTVDSVGRRLYVSHGTHVVVIDADSGMLVGKIDKTPGVHGIAIASELGRGFISNGRAGTVTIFNLKTLETIGEVEVTGMDPDWILYDPPTKRIFTFNNDSSNATAIDAKEGKVVGTIETGGRAGHAASDGKGNLFLSMRGKSQEETYKDLTSGAGNESENKDSLLQIDSQKLTAGKRWPVAPCRDPGTMAMDKKAGRLFLGCRNRLMVIMDSKDGHVIGTVPIGVPDTTAFDPGTGLAFTANFEGTVTVVHQESPNKYSVLETVKTEPQARTMAVDLKTHKIFLPLADMGPPRPIGPNNRPGVFAPNGRGDLIPGTFRVLIYGM